ncbi:COMPLEX I INTERMEDIATE-ASSOCIATED PROTEIN 30, MITOCHONDRIAL [Ceraceosorus bombacis]|uniref:COMPLEX I INTERMEDIATE-ASSOCIATED PROTEIN 30, MITOCHONDRIAL n=1 Tax=Ceraceosorus bombacis TaxID=401625 RepID=A0A0P1BFW6_9BASI|nr:COMPLEX I INTERMEDIATE-ASSOCIATED PROTEIN 30, MITOCHONDRIAL [Ceraceosorus bombacis]
MSYFGALRDALARSMDNRPTIFGNQTWDTTLHPYLLLRVRNRLASPHSPSDTPSLASALHTAQARVKAATRHHDEQQLDLRALHAIGSGLGSSDTPGPKYFVNIQTDGPVTSDLFQHRLWLDHSKGSEWQDVVIPFADFVLLNAGTVASSQMEMMREKVRTIGISATLSTPGYTSEPRKGQAGRPEEAAQQVDKDTAPAAAPSALRAPRIGSQDAAAPARGSQRGQTFNFDLGVDGVWAVGEDRLDGIPEGVEVPRDSLL